MWRSRTANTGERARGNEAGQKNLSKIFSKKISNFLGSRRVTGGEMKSDTLTFTYQLERQHLRDITEMCSGNLIRPHRAVSILFWVLIFVPVVVAISTASSEGPYSVNAGLFLFGFLFATLIVLMFQWSRSMSVWKSWLKLELRNGPIQALFSKQSARFPTTTTSPEYAWPAIIPIRKVKSGTGLDCGVFAYAVPDKALPEGLPPGGFREILLQWKGER